MSCRIVTQSDLVAAFPDQRAVADDDAADRVWPMTTETGQQCRCQRDQGHPRAMRLGRPAQEGQLLQGAIPTFVQQTRPKESGQEAAA
jgi:hypothetical protein